MGKVMADRYPKGVARPETFASNKECGWWHSSKWFGFAVEVAPGPLERRIVSSSSNGVLWMYALTDGRWKEARSPLHPPKISTAEAWMAM